MTGNEYRAAYKLWLKATGAKSGSYLKIIAQVPLGTVIGGVEQNTALRIGTVVRLHEFCGDNCRTCWESGTLVDVWQRDEDGYQSKTETLVPYWVLVKVDGRLKENKQ